MPTVTWTIYDRAGVRTVTSNHPRSGLVLASNFVICQQSDKPPLPSKVKCKDSVSLHLCLQTLAQGWAQRRCSVPVSCVNRTTLVVGVPLATPRSPLTVLSSPAHVPPVPAPTENHKPTKQRGSGGRGRSSVAVQTH